MFAYCVEELRLSEDAAYRRIRAARAARQFPALFTAIEDGRLHLAAVSLLAPHLTSANVDELIEVATHRRKSEVEELLSRRFPGSNFPGPVHAVTSIRPIPQSASAGSCVNDGLLLETPLESDLPVACGPLHGQLFPGRVEGELASGVGPNHDELVPGRIGSNALKLSPSTPGQVGSDGPNGNQLVPGRVAKADAETPLPAQRYLVQVTIAKDTHDKLRRIQALLSHAVPSGDVAQVIDRAFDALLANLEKRKIGAGSARPRSRSARSSRCSTRKRHISAHIRREVWERDQGQCTFVSAAGRRCGARRFLEFDHVEPVARGGVATVQAIRLRCRAHNQYEAERVFGAGFMSQKREEARLAAAETRMRAHARARDEARARALAKDKAAPAEAKEQIRVCSTACAASDV